MKKSEGMLGCLNPEVLSIRDSVEEAPETRIGKGCEGEASRMVCRLSLCLPSERDLSDLLYNTL